MTQPTPRIRRDPDYAPGARHARIRISTWAAAVPALATIAGVILLGMAAAAQRTDSIDARYQRDADAAMTTSDFKTARVCYERLLQRSPSNPALLLGLAKSLEGIGQSADAFQLFQRLAPADAAGYAPAQIYVAEQILRASTDPKSLQLAETHVTRALQADPGNSEARTLLDRLYANTGRPLPPVH